MKYLEKEITNGRDLEKNIPEFMVDLLNVYRKYSYVKLSMNYFTYYEMTGEEKIKDEKLLSLTKKINEIVSEMTDMNVPMNVEQLITQTESLREEVIDIMKGLTSLVDIFNIFEYCLNRVEYNYKDGSEFSRVKDEDITREIMQYILSENDNVVINSKIGETVRQIPVRITKSRFFELLKEGMKVYKESEKSSIDDFVYMIKTVSMLEISDSAFTIAEDITEIVKEFRAETFSDMDEDKYNALRNKLDYAVDYIQNAVNRYMMLQENINDIYVILLTSREYMEQNYALLCSGYEENAFVADEKDIDNCVMLLRMENSLFAGSSYDEVAEQIEDGFIFLEGKQEKYYNKFTKFAYLVETITSDYEETLKAMKLNGLDVYVDKIEKLVSGSLFVEFHQKEDRSVIPGMSYIQEVITEFEREFTAFFKENCKLVNRAVMAHVLSELPVFFNNVEEIQNYVYNGISGCGDKAEKTAVIEIFKGITDEI